jgi:hypothetical protein
MKKRSRKAGWGGAFLVLALQLGACLAEPPAGQDWSMVFNDEFEGTALDLAKWDTIDVCCGHRDHDEYYLGRNCVVEGGILKEIMKRQQLHLRGNHQPTPVPVRLLRDSGQVSFGQRPVARVLDEPSVGDQRR